MRAISCAFRSLNIIVVVVAVAVFSSCCVHSYYFGILSGTGSNMYSVRRSLQLMLHTFRRRCLSPRTINCVVGVGGGAPNWRQIKLGTHYVFDKNFEIV